MDESWVRHIELPYICASNELPSRLPTLEDVHEAPTIGIEGFGRRVAAVGNDYIVKHGSHVTKNEGLVLLFLEKHPRIPAPRLYAMFKEDDELFLVMARMKGQSLDSVWSSLTDKQKESVAWQLKTIVGNMRQIQAPSYFGSITNGPLGHRFFLTPRPDPEINGPFDTERSLNEALANQASRINSVQHQSLPKFLARNLPDALHGHNTFFTHADFHAGNILIIMRDGQYIVSGIVDWDTAGWYPSYWEYAASLIDTEWGNDWPEYLDMIFVPFLLEAATLKMVRQILEY